MAEQVITINDLYRLVRECARNTRQEIDDDNISIHDFDKVSTKYQCKLTWQRMPLNKDGYYSDELKVITLNSNITHPERRKFTFYHELMHNRVFNTDFSEYVDEYTYKWHEKKWADEEEERLIERLCNIGAAELLIPSPEIQQIINFRGFTTAIIPDLCSQFKASSITVAIQIISVASHACHLIIAEKRLLRNKSKQLHLINAKTKRNWQLWVVYSVSSSASKYNIGRSYPILTSHLMYKALENEGKVLEGIDDIPRPRSSNHSWQVKCDCLGYKGWVFGLFHETQPISNRQLKLWDF